MNLGYSCSDHFPRTRPSYSIAPLGQTGSAELREIRTQVLGWVLSLYDEQHKPLLCAA